MRVVLHAGLHKSATTYVQSFWAQAYDDPAGTCWYPTQHAGDATGHSWLVRPLLQAFTAYGDPDLVLGAARPADVATSLTDVVRAAVAQGTETLVLSSEDLDRVRDADLPALHEAFAGHHVTLVLTVTAPVHRWCANWQTLVKRGLAEYPLPAAAHIEQVAALTPGRLESLLRGLPATERRVRLVRTSPAEPALPRELATWLGLPDLGEDPSTVHRNASLGVDTEVMLRINRAGLAIGTFVGGGALLRRLREEGFTYEDVPGLETEFGLSETFREAARVEQALLYDAPADLGLVVDDPHGLLAGWCEETPPSWYTEISRRRAVLPELEPAYGPAEQLWRARQQLAAAQARAQEAEALVQKVRRRAKRLAARVAELETGD